MGMRIGRPCFFILLGNLDSYNIICNYEEIGKCRFGRMRGAPGIISHRALIFLWPFITAITLLK